MSLANSPSELPRSSTFAFLSLRFSESEDDAMSECARACAYGLPPTATVDGLEIEAAGPLVLLENFPDLFRGSLWLHLVYGSSSVTQGDIQIGAKWSQVKRLRGSNGLAVVQSQTLYWAFSGTAGEPCHLSFPGFPPSRTSASARTEGGLLCRHVVGAAHPRGWEHVGAPERALRGGSCFPRIPGDHCF